MKEVHIRGKHYRIDIWNTKINVIFDSRSWVMNTTNVVVALLTGFNELNSKKFISDFEQISYNQEAKDMIQESMEDGGDLNLIYWLSGGNIFWDVNGYCDAIEIFDNFLEDMIEQIGELTEDERDDLYHKYVDSFDGVQEALKYQYNQKVIDLIQHSISWYQLFRLLNELAKEVRDEAETNLKDRMKELVKNLA